MWFDRDQNAVSDAGEVTPLSALNVAGLACVAPERDGPYPLNPRGVELRDGCTLPLWDWIVTPLAASHEGGSLAGGRPLTGAWRILGIFSRVIFA